MKILIAFLFVPFFAHAVEIVDEGNVFEELRMYSQGIAFEEVMKCGQRHSVSAIDASCTFSCTANMCTSTCTEATPPKFDVAVEDCSEGVAHLYGENGMSLRITREDFTKGGGTLAWAFLQDIGRYMKPVGKVVLEQAMPMSVLIIANGDKVHTMGVEIWGHINYGDNVQRASFSMTVLPSFKDARQIGRFGLDPMNYFYKVKGIVNEEGI